MTTPARGSKSKRRSGANSTSKKPHELTFFVDKCLGTRVVPNALRARGVDVEVKTDHFAPDTKDTDWLLEVGKRGWVILSKDKHLRHNYLEIVSLLESGTASFLLTSGNFTGEEMANAFVKALPDIKRMLRKFSAPFVASVTKAGKAHMQYTFDGLIKKVSRGKPRGST
jgi:hypothetical protein